MQKTFPERLKQIIFAFLKLGFVAFGGPAAAYGMMRQEFVTRKGWLGEDDFFDFMGLANLIPGPNAVEMALLIGHHHAGWMGLVLAGVSYIFPSTVVVLIFAWIYQHYGALPAIEGVLYGIKPVVLSILVSAMWGILKPRIKNTTGLIMFVIVFAAYLGGISPMLLLLGGGVLMSLYRMIGRKGSSPGLSLVFPVLSRFLQSIALQMQPFNLPMLFWVFLKAGALMLGSGYVLMAFIHNDLVVRLGWLTDNQIVDAIAVGQVTPGPLATTATFIGFLLGGFQGAFLATAGMFLPSHIIVIILIAFIGKIRGSERFAGFLEGVNFAALGLMVGVTWEISRTALIDPITVIIALVGLIVLLKYKISAAWLVIVGALIGLAL
ncbi:MAG: chromate efflux transporter [Brevefilum sp.]|jgi:chromate transporter